MAESRDELEAFQCEMLARTGVAQVVLRAEASGDFWALGLRQRAQLLARCQLWVEGKKLSSEHMNHNEGRVKKGNINRRIEAFKIHGVRLFGYVRPFMCLKTFIVMDVDSAKKQKKANPRILKRCAQRIVLLEEEFGENYE